jgi:hypothetical protein
MPNLGATFKPFVKENDDQTNYGNDAQNDEGYGERVHFATSIPSRR